MKYFTVITNSIDFINQWVGRLASFLVYPLMFVIVFDVVKRYFLNDPTIWALELSEILLLYMICLGAGTALLHKAHVSVDMLVTRYSERTRAIINVFLWPVLLLICFILVWQGAMMLWDDIVFSSTSDTMWAPPMWISKSMVPMSGLLLGLQGLAEWMRDCLLVVTGIKLNSKYSTGEGGLR